MTAHVHADLMARYAKDAKETDKPWERWQFSSGCIPGEWSDCTTNPNWRLEFTYRRKISNGKKLFNAFYPDGPGVPWEAYCSADKDLYEQAAERFLNAIKE